MGARAVAQAQLSKSVEKRLKAQKAVKKDTVSRGDFYEAARTLQNKLIGVSQATLWNPEKEQHEPCCLLQVDAPESPLYAVAYLNDAQVRELIQVLKDYLSAKEG